MTSSPTDGSRRIAGPADADSAPRGNGAPALRTTHVEQVRTEHHAAPAPAPVRSAQPAVETRPSRPAKTSAAAAFALVFGVAALFCALTALLSPVAIVLGIIGLVLGFVGLKMAKRPGVTGKGVAIGGLVTALLGLILGGVIIGGISAIVNDNSQLDRVQRYVDDARAKLPSTDDVRQDIPGQ